MEEIPRIPVRPSRSSTYRLTRQDKEYLKSFAVDGVIEFNDYITALNEIRKAAVNKANDKGI